MFTVINIGNFVLEVDERGEAGDAVLVGGGWVRDLDEVDAVHVAVVVDVLHDLHHAVRTAGLGVICAYSQV